MRALAPLASDFSNVLVVQLRPLLQKRLLQMIDVCDLSLVDFLLLYAAKSAVYRI